MNSQTWSSDVAAQRSSDPATGTGKHDLISVLVTVTRIAPVGYWNRSFTATPATPHPSPRAIQFGHHRRRALGTW